MGKSINYIPKGPGFDAFIAAERDKNINYLVGHFSLQREVAEDLYQDSSLALYLNIKEGRLTTLTASLNTYFLGICKRQAQKYIEQKNRKFTTDDFNAVRLEIANNHSNYNDECLNEVLSVVADERDPLVEVLNTMKELVVDLPEPCNKLLWGKYWEQLSHKELAAALEYASADGSKTQTSRCLSKFKKRIERLFE